MFLSDNSRVAQKDWSIFWNVRLMNSAMLAMMIELKVRTKFIVRDSENPYILNFILRIWCQK